MVKNSHVSFLRAFVLGLLAAQVLAIEETIVQDLTDEDDV